MPKGRHLKPDFFTDKNIVGMSPLARLLYQGLWCYAADCGHLDDEPVELKMRILPADNCDVDELLDELAWHKRIVRKNGVLEVPRLAEHQKPDKRYATLCDACKADDADPDERKRWGLHKRWHTDRDIIKETCPFCADEHVETTKGQHAESAGSRSEHVEDSTSPRSGHVVDGDGDGDGDGDVATTTQSRKRPATRLPDTWTPTEKHWERRHDGIDVDREAQKFRLHAEANDRRQSNWNASFSQWLLNARPSAASSSVRALPHVSQLRTPPNGLTDEQYDAWLREQP